MVTLLVRRSLIVTYQMPDGFYEFTDLANGDYM